MRDNAPNSSLTSPQWHAWLIPKPFDLVCTFLYICTFVLFIYFHWSLYPSHRYLLLQTVALGGTLLTLLIIDRVEYLRYGSTTPTRAAALLLIARIILVQLAVTLDDNTFAAFLYLLLPFIAMQHFKAWVGYILAITAWFVYLFICLSGAWYLDKHRMSLVILMAMGQMFMIIMAKIMLKEQASRTQAEKLLHELEISHQQLTAYAEQVAELATTKERNRLARDIHDSLGHYLTVINVQLEKALALQDKKPDEAEQAVRDAKRLASEVLQDIRQSVSALRISTESFSIREALNTLADNARSDHLHITVRVEGDEADFGKHILMVLYRAVQEGLTNVQKHAGATQAEITLTFNDYSAELRLSDNGQGFDPTQLPTASSNGDGHYGLQGLQERLELVDGTLHLESVPGNGTQLIIRVPKHSPVQSNLLPAKRIGAR